MKELQPINQNVLLDVTEDSKEQTTASGIIIPDSAKEKPKTAKVVDTSSDTNYTEQVKESYNKLKPEAEKLINKAKAELKKVTSTKNKSAPVTTPDSSDPYNQPDDRYGGTEDKW